MSDWKKDTKNTISKFLKNTNDIKEVFDISSKLKPLGFDSYFYTAHCHKRREIVLGNNINWLKYQRDNVINHQSYHAHHINFDISFSIIELDMFPKGNNIYDMYDYGMRSAIYLIYNTNKGEYFESFVFACNYQPDVANKLALTNLEYLKEFCLYFKDKASHIIKNNKIIVPNKSEILKTPSNQPLEKLRIDRFYLPYPYNEIFLTRKQIILLKDIISGRSFKEIAIKHGISFRTVEKHLEIIKTKVGVMSKYELFQILLGTRLFESLSDD